MTIEPTSSVIPIHGAAVAAVLKLLDGQRLMTLASNRADGRPQASTLGYLNDGLNLYFVTARDSEKLRNITADRAWASPYAAWPGRARRSASPSTGGPKR